MKKRILSFAMALAMVLSILPVPALAAEGCANHPVHDESCGYVAAVEGQPCNHQHSEVCRVETTVCTHVHTAECYPEGDMEGEPTLCEHVCSEESGCVTVSCNHVHNAECGYVEAVAGQPCKHSCKLCNPPEKPEEEVVCTCGVKCNEMVDHDCPVCDADPSGCQGKAPEEPAAEPETVLVTAWTWVDPEEYLVDGGLALPGASAEIPATFAVIVSMLPAAILADGIELPLTWACPEFPAQGAYQGTYRFTAALPEGYALAEGELTIPVDLGGVTTYEADPVAQVVSSDGTRTTFDSLEGAVNSAQDGDTVELLTAASLSTHLSIDKNITLSVKAPLSIEQGSITIGDGKSVIIEISTGCSITDINPGAISIRVSGTLTVTGEGSINCFVRVMQPGKIERGTFSGSVNNMGTINAGLFNGSSDSTYVSNEGTINGGTFETIVYNDGTIKEGIFKEQVDFGRMTHRRGTVSGGQFALQPNANTPAGKKLANIGGQYPWRVVDADAVAAASGQTYLSLAAAATAAKPGETITLLEDTEVDWPYEVELDNDLNLNGHNITVNANYGIQINEGANVTVTSGNILKGGDSFGYTLMVKGEFSTTGSVEGGVLVNNGTLNGGTYTGIISGDGTIQQGSFSGDVGYCVINGGTFNNEHNYNCTINGGTFNGEVKYSTISGGSFKIDPRTNYLSNTISDGFVVQYSGGETPYQVVSETSTDAQAQIGDTRYTTLQAALDAAGSGSTVVLLKDVSDDEIVIDKDIIIDLNGKTPVFGEVKSGTFENSGDSGMLMCYQISDGTFDCEIYVFEKILNGTFLGSVISNNEIFGGTFKGFVANLGTIYCGNFEYVGGYNDGTQQYEIDLINGGKISGGFFDGVVAGNGGTVNGGYFKEELDETITIDKFYAKVPSDKEGYAYMVVHEHAYIYEAEGSKLTVTCEMEDCALNENPATATLTATDAVYDGTAKNAAVTYSANWPSTLAQPTVTYDGDTTNVGTVTASITLGSKTVQVTYQITQSGTGMTMTTGKDTYVYGETITATVTVTATGTPKLRTAPTANQVAIFSGTEQLTEPQTVTSGEALTFTFNSSALGAGNATLTAQYIESGNMAGQTATASVTVTPKPLAVTLTGTTTKVYDGTTACNGTGLTLTVEGVLDVDTVTHTVTYTYDDANVGDRTVTANITLGGADAGNYKLPEEALTAAGTITAKAVTITVDNKNATEGDPMPTLTYTVSGLLGNDKLVKEPTLVCNADMSKPGEHTITASGADAGSNYEINYVPGKLTVEARSIFTVTFDSNSGSAVAAQTVKSGDKVIKPKDPTRPKHNFKGWYTDEECTKAYDFDAPVTGNLTLHAKWAEVYTFTLNYKANTSATVRNMPKDESVTSERNEMTFRLSYSKPKRSGYTFTGWNTQANGKGTKYQPGDPVPGIKDGTVTLYAQWKQNSGSWWDNPKTGDYIMIAVAVLAVSGVALAGLLVYSKKKKK